MGIDVFSTLSFLHSLSLILVCSSKHSTFAFLCFNPHNIKIMISNLINCLYDQTIMLSEQKKLKVEKIKVHVKSINRSISKFNIDQI